MALVILLSLHLACVLPLQSLTVSSYIERYLHTYTDINLVTIVARFISINYTSLLCYINLKGKGEIEGCYFKNPTVGALNGTADSTVRPPSYLNSTDN